MPSDLASGLFLASLALVEAGLLFTCWRITAEAPGGLSPLQRSEFAGMRRTAAFLLLGGRR